MIRAIQVPPEEQQAPDFEYEDLVYIAFDGNRNYHSRWCDEYGQAKHFLNGCMSYIYDDAKIEKAVNEYLTYREPLPLDKTKEIWKILISYENLSIPYSEAIIRVLRIWTGCPWDVRSIRGSVQSEWQNVYYDSSCYSVDDIRKIEAIYFNTGTQWEVFDEDEYYTVYCYEYDDTKIKEEIADYIQKDVSEIHFEKFDGYKRTPMYKEF